MSKFNFSCLLLTVTLALSACGGKIKPEPLSSTAYYSDDYTGVIEVPFTNEDGVRIIHVRINGSPEYPMIFDTGCSGVSISVLELGTLLKYGYISEEDVLDEMVETQIADGSTTTEHVVNIRKLQIGDYECHNVKAYVSENIEAPLLLGNEALKEVKSFIVDEEDKVIRFQLR
ncbi:MAG: clan AA aspartic protease [Paludibacteraceae bacterium]|nr:clan AA aspartic protease [Paludibacteraceae bacterium]